MSSNTDRQRKLEELRRRKEEMDAKKAQLAANRAQHGGSALLSRREVPTNQEDQPAANTPSAPPKKEGPIIEYSNFVGVFNLPAKQKAYMYDRCIEVTKEQIELLKELQQEEEKLPQYNFKEDENLDDDDEFDDGKKKNSKTRCLPDEEVERIFNKPSFRKFIRKGSDIIDSELSDDDNSMYEDLIANNEVGVGGEKAMLSMSFNFFDEAVKGYKVTNVVWCKTNADWLLVTYSTSDITEKYPSKILVWSMKSKSKPVMEFDSLHKITRSVFHSKNENIIYATTYTGHVLEFKIDGKPTPENKNFNLSENGEYHATPIFVLEFFSHEEKDFLISVSIDGKLCIWNIEYLMEPVVDRILESKKDSISKQKLDCYHSLTSTIINAGTEDVAIVIGTFDSLLVHVKLATLFLPPEELAKNEVATEHKAPICHLSGKSDPNRAFLNDLFLTTSFDYEMQIWRINSVEGQLIKRFDFFTDYVVAAEWNPVQPVIFAATDCNGKFLAFDLAENPDYFTFEGEAAPCSCMKWSPDGFKLCFGTLDGRVQIWYMHKNFLKVDEEKVRAVSQAL